MGWIARLRRIRPTTVAAGGAVLIDLVGVGLVVAAPSGDPGGRILNELRPVAAALPDGAKIAYRQDIEPRWDSCDGRPGTFGWDDAVVIVHFTTTLSPGAVGAHADAALRPLGWTANATRYQESVFAYTWAKTLRDGTTARAQISNDGQNPDTWDLYAGAALVGPRVSGC